jgi:DNA-binding MarR family transcriptional regulator
VTAPTRRPARLHLPDFIPFRLNRLAAAVSDHLSAIYRERFGLEIPEWRVMATVGLMYGCNARFIGESTRMHKTRVSRAISGLVRRGLIRRLPYATDKREMPLRLTPAGRRVYTALVPLALEREQALLRCLTGVERRSFQRCLGRLEEFLGVA